jgi:hypothetical protein
LATSVDEIRVTQQIANNNNISLKAKSLNPIYFIEENTMAFANEYLTDEEERKKYGSAHVTIDRERDAWLTRSGGGGERPDFVELHWQGEEIKMHAYQSRAKTVDDKLIITWQIAKMSIPEKLEIHRPEILQMVREALIAHKCHGLKEHDHLVKATTVEISTHVINYKVGEPTWM